jgi:integrase
MFSIAVGDLSWRADNPARGVKRNEEVKRERYLSGEEIARLTKALSEHKDQTVANIIRLLLLTGARRGEVFQAEWSQLDLDGEVWVKPSAMTKQAKLHRVPLSDGAVALLKGIHEAAPRDSAGNLKSKYVFPGPRSGQPMTEIKDEWRAIAIAAGLYDEAPPAKKGGKPVKVVNCRIHDLRHTYASLLVSAGLSLPIIGALLGHTQASTTHRYAHLMDDPLRQATNQVSAIVGGKKSADVHDIREGVA